MAQKVQKTTVLVTALSERETKEMFALFEKYYDHVDYERFLKDLQEKTHVFMFREPTGRLVGFSTIFRRTIPSIAKGLFLFSGDTVIHEDHWGNKMLQKAFFWFIVESKLRTPFAPLYWMLMSKGVKTYLMMRKNFERSYPNRLGPTPAEFERVRNEFYALKFPQDFNKERGLILFKEKLGSVKGQLLSGQKNDLRDPEAQFFYEANPDHEKGDELACACEIQFRDFFFHIFKFFIPVRKRR